MSLATQVSALATRIGQEIKAVRAEIAALPIEDPTKIIGPLDDLPTVTRPTFIVRRNVSATTPVVTSISANGHYFLDQFNDPIMMKGDSPWLALPMVSVADWTTYCEARAAQGFNLLALDLVGWNPANSGVPGAPNIGTGGATYDSISPFVGGNITSLNEPYWARVDQFATIAADYGITLAFYLIDYYSTVSGEAFYNVSAADAQAYGAAVGNRYKNFPNIVWMFGNDYSETTPMNTVWGACLTGLRGAGDTHPLSIMLYYHLSYSTDSSYWTTRVEYNGVYTYPVQYDSMKIAYELNNGKPAVMIEAAYIGESYTGGTVQLTTNKQVGWSLTQGAAGDWIGTEDWWFKTGWLNRLTRAEVESIAMIRAIISSIAWWTLVPSTTLLSSGAGTRLVATSTPPGSANWPAASDYASQAVSADKTLAVVYLPTQRAIQINLASVGTSPVGTWHNTTTGATTAAGSLASAITPPSAGDWILTIGAS